MSKSYDFSNSSCNQNRSCSPYTENLRLDDLNIQNLQGLHDFVEIHQVIERIKVRKFYLKNE